MREEREEREEREGERERGGEREGWRREKLGKHCHCVACEMPPRTCRFYSCPPTVSTLQIASYK